MQYILDSVVSELQVGPNRRFIYVEIAYFYRWWNQLHDSGRHVVKGLVNNGEPAKDFINMSLYILAEVFCNQ